LPAGFQNADIHTTAVYPETASRYGFAMNVLEFDKKLFPSIVSRA
jgi:hypothetical protein